MRIRHIRLNTDCYNINAIHVQTDPADVEVDEDDVGEVDDDDEVEVSDNDDGDGGRMSDEALKELICKGRWCRKCGHDLHSGGQCHCMRNWCDDEDYDDDEEGGDHEKAETSRLYCGSCGFIECICSRFEPDTTNTSMDSEITVSENQ